MRPYVQSADRLGSRTCAVGRRPSLLLHRLVFFSVKTPARLLAVILVMSFVVAVPAAALALDDGVVLATEEPADETPADEPMFEEGQEPAEIAPPAAEDDAEQPWTTRFLAPALLLMGIVALIGSIAYYGVRVRNRYEIVD